MVKLSSELDYEQWGVLITALIKDENGNPVSGASVKLDIYYPKNGSFWMSDVSMIETPIEGVYSWSYEGDPLLPKGLYIASVKASHGGGDEVTDMLVFHIDPPVSSTNYYRILFYILLILILLKFKSDKFR